MSRMLHDTTRALKILCIILFLMPYLSVMSAQKVDRTSSPTAMSGQNGISKNIPSGLYRISDQSIDQVIMSGPTKHFSGMTLRYLILNQSEGKQELKSGQEQILIIREGEATVTLGQESKTIGPNIVFFLLPGETGSISAQSPDNYFTANQMPFS